MSNLAFARIYVAGHRGLAGSALTRAIRAAGCTDVVTRTHADLDLTDPVATRAFFTAEKPDIVVLAAAKVGGIYANDTYPADFVRENLAIELNVISECWRSGVKRLLFLGSSCIYPKYAPQPLQETSLLSGPLERTNRAYAIAKIAGIEMCWSYNRQHKTRYLAVMPTNLYGPGDNYDPENSHVLPALLRRFHEAKVRGAREVIVWGSGRPRREFLYSDDLASACLHLLQLPDSTFDSLTGSSGSDASDAFDPPLINIGVGEDIAIEALARLIAGIVGYSGRIEFDPSKPDGTPQKLLDVSKLAKLGWVARTPLEAGIRLAYKDFLAQQPARPHPASEAST